MIENLFPVPVWRAKYTFAAGEQEELVELITEDSDYAEAFELDEHGEHYNGALEGDAITTYEVTKFATTHPITDPIRAFVISEAEKYWSAMGWNSNVRPIIGSGWTNLYRKGGHVIAHNHGFIPIACAFYVNVPQNGGDFLFMNPLEYAWSCNPYIDWPKREWHPMNIASGDLVLFPGWLKHATVPNRNETENRIIISYNLSAEFIN